MASGVESKLLVEGTGRDSGSEDERGQEEESAPRTVSPPVPDGLPQTGPKGVLTDFYRTQEEERRKQILEDKKRKELIEKHTAKVKSTSSSAIVNLAKALDDGSLDQDPFMQEYRAKRLEEMKQQAKLGSQRVLFGNLMEIRGDNYATAIDTAPPQTFVVLHIYDELFSHSQLMNKCLAKLAKLYPMVKFCRVQSHQVGVSLDFVQNALPALLVYKGGELKGNHLRVTDTLGHEFTVEDVESFLQDHNCLPPEGQQVDFMAPDPPKHLHRRYSGPSTVK